ncbi:MAG: flagellar export chaperone FlgN [Phycisphaerales bacterium]|nr:flagellar export chaperone FlgN [Phycisphaerales bacterium]
MSRSRRPDTHAPSSAGSRLVGVLRRQLELVERVHAQAARQAKLLANRDADGLAALVHERNGAVSAIQAGEAELASALAEFGTGTAPDRQQVAELMASIEQRLEAVRTLDAATAEAIGAKRDEVRRELAANGAGRQAHGAYAAHAVAPMRDTARYADRRA